ncbi:MAG: PH domain-containing protein [Planctomycetaceae bacterium]
MAILITCPACAFVTTAPDHFAGKTGKCPQCSQLIKIPPPGPVAASAGRPGSGGSPAAAPTPAVESTLWIGRPSQWANFPVFVGCGLFFWLVIPIVISLFKYLSIRCSRYELTTERLVISHGILSKRTDQLELYRVKDTVLEEPWYERLVSLGDVILHTSDRTDPIIRIRAIADARRVCEQFRKYSELRRDQKGVREVDFV